MSLPVMRHCPYAGGLDAHVAHTHNFTDRGPPLATLLGSHLEKCFSTWVLLERVSCTAHTGQLAMRRRVWYGAELTPCRVFDVEGQSPDVAMACVYQAVCGHPFHLALSLNPHMFGSSSLLHNLVWLYCCRALRWRLTPVRFITGPGAGDALQLCQNYAMKARHLFLKPLQC